MWLGEAARGAGLCRREGGLRGRCKAISRPGVADVSLTFGVLTPAQQEVVSRLGAVEVGRRVRGDHVYVY
jgi:hypothetical protein